jgi:hypothetical protein
MRGVPGFDSRQATIANGAAKIRASPVCRRGIRGDISSGDAHIFHIKEGRVTKLIRYFDREHALCDLGLSEQDVHADSS